MRCSSSHQISTSASGYCCCIRSNSLFNFFFQASCFLYATFLLRANKAKSIARLDDLAKFLEHLPITTTAMRQAAQLWAQAHQQGQPTAGDKTIDGDMILVVQAMTLAIPNFVIAWVICRGL